MAPTLVLAQLAFLGGLVFLGIGIRAALRERRARTHARRFVAGKDPGRCRQCGNVTLLHRGHCPYCLAEYNLTPSRSVRPFLVAGALFLSGWSLNARVQDSWRTPSTAASPASAPASSGAPGATWAPTCAENGSCYGDISPASGRPKTVYVRGYYRRDGTYVRSHYRSPPRGR